MGGRKKEEGERVANGEVRATPTESVCFLLSPTTGRKGFVRRSASRVESRALRTRQWDPSRVTEGRRACGERRERAADGCSTRFVDLFWSVWERAGSVCRASGDGQVERRSFWVVTERGLRCVRVCVACGCTPRETDAPRKKEVLALVLPLSCFHFAFASRAAPSRTRLARSKPGRPRRPLAS